MDEEEGGGGGGRKTFTGIEMKGGKVNNENAQYGGGDQSAPWHHKSGLMHMMEVVCLLLYLIGC